MAREDFPPGAVEDDLEEEEDAERSELEMMFPNWFDAGGAVTSVEAETWWPWPPNVMGDATL
jgi:hypothetical protein